MFYSIFFYYAITIFIFSTASYYAITIVEISSLPALLAIISPFALLGALLLSRLSTQPLLEHIQNLQNLSKETLHELNLPLSTIKTNLSMLKKNITEPKDIARLGRIEQACVMLQERYDELEYGIKLQSLAVEHESFELDELIGQRVAFLKEIYTQMEFELHLQPLSLTNDKKGISKIIDSLIDNAVKYSATSTKVTISIIGSTLHIQDYGKGIDEMELVKIFDNYYQSNKSAQGFGLGLGIVKRFCDSNKIKLRINSKIGDGTTVSLTF